MRRKKREATKNGKGEGANNRCVPEEVVNLLKSIWFGDTLGGNGGAEPRRGPKELPMQFSTAQPDAARSNLGDDTFRRHPSL